MLMSLLLVLIVLGGIALTAGMAHRAIDGERADAIDDWYRSGQSGTPVLSGESESPLRDEIPTPI